MDLKPEHGHLVELGEAVKASIRVSVVQGMEELAHVGKPLTVLAYDQWAGTRAQPELLAAFCMPNNPAINVVVEKASKLLRNSYPELSMNGYQSKSRDVVWKQVSALYSAIAAEGFGARGLRGRPPAGPQALGLGPRRVPAARMHSWTLTVEHPRLAADIFCAMFLGEGHSRGRLRLARPGACANRALLDEAVRVFLAAHATKH